MPADYTRLGLDRRLIQNLCHYDGDYLLPIGSLKASDTEGLKARAQKAAEIADDPTKLDDALKRVLASLRKNNPVLFYGAITSGEGDVHVITIAGYCRLREVGKEPSLWLLIADPAQPPVKEKSARPRLNGIEAADLERRQSKDEVIQLVVGNWDTAQASLYLLKASTVFREKPGHLVPHGLWMDYWSTESKVPEQGAGGRIGVGDRLEKTPVAEGGVVSSLLGWKYRAPLDGPGVATNPWRLYANNESAGNAVGGYYVVGLKRNVHGGVHLYPDPNPATEVIDRTVDPLGGRRPAAKPAQVEPPAESKLPRTMVRCLGPGYIVAARLPGLDAVVLKREVVKGLGQCRGSCW